MACNPNRVNCSAESVFAGVARPLCGQFFNPETFQAEQLMYDAAFGDIINSFGIPVDYYIHTYSLTGGDHFYGEHPTAIFYGPIRLMMYVELTENAISLSKFGFDSGDELTGYLHIKTFEDTVAGKEFYIQTSTGEFLQYEQYINGGPSIGFFDLIGGDFEIINKYLNSGQSPEPKSGDLVQLSPLGCDRPNGRGAKIFEVTERTDQDIASINPLLGHYVYRLKAKRFEYSYEPGAPKEPVNDQVFENSFSGKLSSAIEGETPSDSKVYPGDVDQGSKTKVMDMSVNNTDIYGTYY